jgi:hypothetical protein
VEGAMSDEHAEAIKLAKRILERVNADPDDDLAVLSRQFLRSEERNEQLLVFVSGDCDDA